MLVSCVDVCAQGLVSGKENEIGSSGQMGTNRGSNGGYCSVSQPKNQVGADKSNMGYGRRSKERHMFSSTLLYAQNTASVAWRKKAEGWKRRITATIVVNVLKLYSMHPWYCCLVMSRPRLCRLALAPKPNFVSRATKKGSWILSFHLEQTI